MMTPAIPLHALSWWMQTRAGSLGKRTWLGVQGWSEATVESFKLSNCALARWTRTIRIVIQHNKMKLGSSNDSVIQQSADSHHECESRRAIQVNFCVMEWNVAVTWSMWPLPNMYMTTFPQVPRPPPPPRMYMATYPQVPHPLECTWPPSHKCHPPNIHGHLPTSATPPPPPNSPVSIRGVGRSWGGGGGGQSPPHENIGGGGANIVPPPPHNFYNLKN